MPENPLLAQRYRLLTEVGRGGMGTVWHARDEVLGRDVAVKEVILPHGFSDEERVVQHKRTFREARTAARLSHPGVVTVYDVVEEDGRPWIVMELIRARSLDEHIDQDGPLEPVRVAEIGLQVANALTVAHEAGILHRDVKPSNVLVGESRSVRAVLTDFGVARAHSDSTITQVGGLIGSPAYIAPERASGQPASAASDLWSLGATLYRAVEGKSPFERPEMVASLIAVLNDDPVPMEQAGPLQPVIEGLLRKDPNERLTAAAITAMLERIVADDGGPARSASSDEPIGTGSAGRDAPTKAVVSTEATVRRREDPSAAADLSPKPRKARPTPLSVLLIAALIIVLADVFILILL
jgi:serine/threonine protein kinase